MTPELEARTLRNVTPRVLAVRWEKVYAAAARCRWLPGPIEPCVLQLWSRMVKAADLADREPWGFRAWEDGQLAANLLQFKLEDESRRVYTDEQRGQLKTIIDSFNAQRTERINDIDHWFYDFVKRHGSANWRSIESPGSILDRLSILFIKTKRFKGEKRERAEKQWRGLLQDWGAFLKALRRGEATFRYYGGVQKEYGHG